MAPNTLHAVSYRVICGLEISFTRLFMLTPTVLAWTLGSAYLTLKSTSASAVTQSSGGGKSVGGVVVNQRRGVVVFQGQRAAV